jgi:hypothetical protein
MRSALEGQPRTELKRGRGSDAAAPTCPAIRGNCTRGFDPVRRKQSREAVPRAAAVPPPKRSISPGSTTDSLATSTPPARKQRTVRKYRCSMSSQPASSRPRTRRQSNHTASPSRRRQRVMSRRRWRSPRIWFGPSCGRQSRFNLSADLRVVGDGRREVACPRLMPGRSGQFARLSEKPR